MDQQGPWQKSDTLIAGLLAVGTILSRWPFQIDVLNNLDAVNYALALEHFDMRLHQPHAPGYPLYILLARTFDLVFQDHLVALVWLSTVFSGLAVMALYLAGREMFGRRAGLIAALLLATSAPFWFQGEIAAPYTADLFASALVGWLCYKLANSSGERLVWAVALVMGLTGAFRPQTLVFLFPLFLYALRRRRIRTILGAVSVAGGVFGAFFAPAVMVSGGPAAFVKSMRVTVPIFYSTKTLVESTRVNRFLGNLETIGRYTLPALGELTLPFVALGYLTRDQARRPWQNARLCHLFLWLLPVWIVYFLIWPGNPGTALVYLPPLFLLAAAGLNWLTRRSKRFKVVGWAALIVILVWQVTLFTTLPQYPLGQAYRRFDTHETVDWLSTYYRAKLALVKELPVEGTVIYANAFRHLQYYLPQYRTFSSPALFRVDPTRVKSVVSIENGAMETWHEVSVADLAPPSTMRIVLFDLPLDILLADDALVEEKSQNGHAIYVVAVSDQATARWTAEGLRVYERE